MKRIKKNPVHEGWKSFSILKTLRLVWDFIFKDADRVPDVELPVMKPDMQLLTETRKDGLASSWLGHSSVFINIAGYKIITDPVFKEKVTIAGPKRFYKDFPMDYKSLESVDIVLISHNHYDHLNEFSIKFLKAITKKFFVPFGVGRLLEKWGVDKSNIVEMIWWQEKILFGDLIIVSTPSQHFSGRGLLDRNQTLWTSWVVKSGNHSFFFSGDTGYFSGFKEIGRKYGPFDVNFLECGAYNSEWHYVHMFPEETVQAHLDLGGDFLHPVHWGTFNLSMHPWYEPMERVWREAKFYSIDLLTPYPGETIDYSSVTKSFPWWKPLTGKEVYKKAENKS